MRLGGKGSAAFRNECLKGKKEDGNLRKRTKN